MLFLIFATAILFLLGLFKPEASLFWYNKQRTRTLSSLVYGGFLTALIYDMSPADRKVPETKDVNFHTLVDTTVTQIDSNISASATDPVKIEEARVTEKLKSRAGRD